MFRTTLIVGLVALALLLCSRFAAQAENPQAAPDDPLQRELAARPQHERKPSDEAAKQLSGLEQRLTFYRAVGFSAKARETAEAIAHLRTREQGADHWETRDAQKRADDLRQVRTAEQLAKIAEAELSNVEFATIFRAGQYQIAQPLAERMLRLYREALGEKHLDSIPALNNLAVLYSAQSKFAQAEAIHRQMLQIREKALGDKHPQVALTLNNLATVCHEQGNLAEAERLYNRALAIRRDALGEKSVETAASLGNLALVYHKQGKVAMAEPMFRESLAICRQGLGDDHEHTLTSLNNLAEFLESVGKSSAAEPLFLEVLATRRKKQGDKHPAIAVSLMNLSGHYRNQAKYALAEPLCREALAIWQAAYGEKHPHTAAGLANLAMVLDSQGKAAEGETFALSALKIRREIFGDKHPETISSLETLAALYETQDKYATAEPLRREALKTHREVLGDRHPSTAESLHWLGLHLYLQGRYVEAEHFCRSALQARQELLGAKHPQTIESLNTLAEIYRLQGKFGEAELLNREAVAHSREVFGDSHLQTAISLNQLAELFRYQQKYAAAEQSCREALAIVRAVGDGGVKQKAMILNNLALLRRAQGESTEAIEMLTESLELYRASFGKHRSTASTLTNLAWFRMARKEFAEAETMHHEALQMRRELLGENHPSTAQSLNALTVLYRLQNREAEAEQMARAGVRSYEASRLLHARPIERSVGNEHQNPYLLLATQLARAGKHREAYETWEFQLARGLLDEGARRRNESLAADDLARREVLLQRLQTILPQIGQLGTQAERTTQQQQQFAQLLATRRELDTELANFAVELSQRQVADSRQIQSVLPANAALVSWVSVSYGNSGLQERWACIVRNLGEPIWVPLPGTGGGFAWTTDDADLAATFRDTFRAQTGATDIARLADRLHRQRIKPLEQHLSGIRSLYIAAVEEMAGIPIEALTTKYTISYIPSGTFLARREPRPEKRPANLLAVGDPVFAEARPQVASKSLPPGGLLILQVLPGGTAAQSLLKPGDVLVKYAGEDIENVEQLQQLIAKQSGEKTVPVQIWRESAEKLATYDLAVGKLGLSLAKDPAVKLITARRQSQEFLANLSRGEAWTELPGSQVEIHQLTSLFDAAAVSSLTRSDANETKLDELRKTGELTKFRFVHFATHGEANNVSLFASKLILSRDQATNTTAVVPTGEPLLDNELTAGEVLDHWRLDAELVTLSACETALGKSAGGDGMLGFAQAFLLAGSRSVCLSLWKVDDTATALLMDRFYRNLLGKREDGAKPMGKAAALHEAKNWLMNLTLAEATDRLGVLTDGISRSSKKGREVIGEVPAPKDSARDSKPYSHPKYWAAFILIGDPD